MNKTRKKIHVLLEDLRNSHNSLVNIDKMLESEKKNLEVVVTYNSELNKSMKIVQSKLSELRSKRDQLHYQCQNLHSMIKR